MATNEEVSKNLSLEERLKSLLFQYSKLYARWAEDREIFNKGMADQEDMLKDFSQKISEFGELEPNVRQQLIRTIEKSLSNLTEDIGTNIGHHATAAVHQTANGLKSVVKDASELLNEYQVDVRLTNTRFFMIQIIASAVAIAVSFLMTLHVIHKMPPPMLPLDRSMLQTYVHGEALEDAWAGLSKRNQREIIEVIHKKTGLNPLSDLSSGGNANGAGN